MIQAIRNLWGRCKITREVSSPEKIFIYVNMPAENRSSQRQDGFREFWSRSDRGQCFNNKITTSKYTAADFFPRSIFYQFKSVSNLYFLFLAIIQTFHTYSQSIAFFSIAPLIIVLSLNALKDGIEDVRRHLTDRQLNNRKVTVIRGIPNTNLPLKRRCRIHKFKTRLTKRFVKHGSKLYDLFGRLTQNFQFQSREPFGKKEDADSSELISKLSGMKYTSSLGEVKLLEVLPNDYKTWLNEQKRICEMKLKTKDLKLERAAWTTENSKNIAPGDFVLLVSDEEIPSDCLLFASSSGSGTCQVENKNLDGETNLKIKRCIKELNKYFTPEKCAALKIKIELDKPTNELNLCNGNIIFPEDGKSVSFNVDNVLLRGSVLKNTQWVVCLALYTGRDTKIIQNVSENSFKRSVVNKLISVHSLIGVVIMGSLCTICTIAGMAYTSTYITKSDLFSASEADRTSTARFKTAISVFTTCIIIFQNIIPISLVVSVEGCKLVYSLLIYLDNHFLNPETGNRVAVQSWTLLDDLGQIEYVFSDKTGTLTMNMMTLKALSIEGKAYRCALEENYPISYPEAQIPIVNDVKNTARIDIEPQGPTKISGDEVCLDTKSDEKKGTPVRFDKLNLYNSSHSQGDLRAISSSATNKSTGLPTEFRRNSIHTDTCLTYETDDECPFGPSGVNKVKLQAIEFSRMIDGAKPFSRYSTGNPPKKNNLRKSFVNKYIPTKGEALVSGITSRGLMRSTNYVDQDLKMLVRTCSDFSPTMLFFLTLSICQSATIEESLVDGRVNIEYCASSPDESALLEAAKSYGFVFLNMKNGFIKVSVLGETMIFKILHTIEFNSDRKRMSVIIETRDKRIYILCKGADDVILGLLDKKSQMDLIENTIRHSLDLSNEGLRVMFLAYKIIDRNQYEKWLENITKRNIQDSMHLMIPELEIFETDLNLLGAVGIEDKLQEGVPDAISIMVSCGIKIWMLTGDKVETAISIGISCRLITSSTTLIYLTSMSHSEILKGLVSALETHWDENGKPRDKTQTHGLIVDGETLNHVLTHITLKYILLELACRCSAVLFCRVSPLQKSQVVELVKSGLGALCLSIGDGSNDVSMIRTANVGIGIQGREGSQAMFASDYAIEKFHHIIRLMFAHGRPYYMRTSALILNYFYKNMYLLLIIFWYQFFCGFSATSALPLSFNILFNPALTLLQTLSLGFFENDVRSQTSIKYSKLYKIGIMQYLYSINGFWLAILEGVYQSIVSYYVSYFIFRGKIDSKSGTLQDSKGFSIYLTAVVYIVVQLTTLLCFSTWCLPVLAFTVFSGIIFFFYLSTDMTNDGWKFSLTPIYHIMLPVPILAIVLIVTFALLPRLLTKTFFKTFRNKLTQEAQLYEISQEKKERSNRSKGFH